MLDAHTQTVSLVTLLNRAKLVSDDVKIVRDKLKDTIMEITQRQCDSKEHSCTCKRCLQLNTTEVKEECLRGKHIAGHEDTKVKSDEWRKLGYSLQGDLYTVKKWF